MTDDDERDLPGDVAAAFTMRSRGTPYRAIAAELGIATATAHRHVQRAAEALEFSVAADRHAQRAREAAALDRYTARLEDDLADKEADATTLVPVLLRVSAARRALLGLDQPRRVAVSDDRPDPQPDPALADAIRSLQESNRAARDGARRDTGDVGDRGDDPGERAR